MSNTASATPSSTLPQAATLGSLDPALFRRFSKLVYDKCGIVLKPGKEALVSARLAKRLRAMGMTSPRQYLHRLETDAGGEELVYFLDAISTNFTSFFREPDHFELLRREVKRWLAQGCSRIRIWSAASSTGEEPYSIAITVLEAVDGRPIDFKLLATDISTQVLETARAGVYPADRFEGMPRAQLLRNFDRIGKRGTAEEHFVVKEALRESVIFKRLNLAKPPFPMQGPLDMAFCRNVMIYFDRPVRQGLISEIERLLRPGSYLAIGHTETLSAIRTGLSIVRPSVFRKAG